MGMSEAWLYIQLSAKISEMVCMGLGIYAEIHFIEIPTYYFIEIRLERTLEWKKNLW